MKPVLQANIKEGEYKMKYCPYCGAEITNGAVSFCQSAAVIFPIYRRNRRK